MLMLREHKLVLAALTTRAKGGETAAQVAALVAPQIWSGTWANHADRKRTMHVFSWLRELEQAGLVERLDDDAPIAWVLREGSEPGRAETEGLGAQPAEPGPDRDAPNPNTPQAAEAPAEPATLDDEGRCALCFQAMDVPAGHDPTPLCCGCANDEVDRLRDALAARQAEPLTKDAVLALIIEHSTVTDVEDLQGFPRMRLNAEALADAIAARQAEPDRGQAEGAQPEPAYSDKSYIADLEYELNRLSMLEGAQAALTEEQERAAFEAAAPALGVRAGPEHLSAVRGRTYVLDSSEHHWRGWLARAQAGISTSQQDGGDA